ncbi:XK-related protein 8-like [Limulus polyphemus]|uniref:XK-related protein n=1 Tax=Limulus polyphemus TaxID=6850 RepID=A0ABM1T2I4_LIMPO|nr:XK-related protein 8-like [Limulus polyphemus]
MMDEGDQKTSDNLLKDEVVDHDDECDGECYFDEKYQTTSDHLLKDEVIDHDNKCDGECYFDEKHQTTSDHLQKAESIDYDDKCDATCYSDEKNQTTSDCLQQDEDEDHNDYYFEEKLLGCFLPEEEHKFTFLKKLGMVVGMMLFVIDFVLDIVVCYQYYRKGDKAYFGITVAIIISSSLLHTLWSLFWYLKFEKGFVSVTRWIFRVIFLVLPLSPVLRTFEAFWYGIKFQRSNKESRNYYYDRFCSCFLNAVELRLAESFMEAAPQLLIQAFIQIRIIPRNALYPTGQAYKDFIVRIVSIVSSLLSLAWSLVCYYDRLFMEHRLCFKTKIKILIFLWQFFSIASRMTALVLFASFNLEVFGIYCGLRVVFVISINLGKGGRIFKCNW